MVYLLAVRPECPQCGGRRVHHSRPRSIAERLRRTLTFRVPYRCHSCGWRGWMRETGPTAPAGPRPTQGELTDAELEALESGVERVEGDPK